MLGNKNALDRGAIPQRHHDMLRRLASTARRVASARGKSTKWRAHLAADPDFLALGVYTASDLQYGQGLGRWLQNQIDAGRI